ncbi:putative reverse transcriptase domain-containing protein [Tanacetum coccineum]
MTIDINFPSQILNAQAEEMKKENVKEENLHDMDKEFETRPDGTLCIRNRSWVYHALADLRDLIMKCLPDITPMEMERITKYFAPVLYQRTSGYNKKNGRSPYGMDFRVSIISDRDSRFTSHLWLSLQKAFGARLDMSTTYHP